MNEQQEINYAQSIRNQRVDMFLKVTRGLEDLDFTHTETRKFYLSCIEQMDKTALWFFETEAFLNKGFVNLVFTRQQTQQPHVVPVVAIQNHLPPVIATCQVPTETVYQHQPGPVFVPNGAQYTQQMPHPQNMGLHQYQPAPILYQQNVHHPQPPPVQVIHPQVAYQQVIAPAVQQGMCANGTTFYQTSNQNFHQNLPPNYPNPGYIASSYPPPNNPQMNGGPIQLPPPVYSNAPITYQNFNGHFNGQPATQWHNESHSYQNVSKNRNTHRQHPMQMPVREPHSSTMSPINRANETENQQQEDDDDSESDVVDETEHPVVQTAETKEEGPSTTEKVDREPVISKATEPKKSVPVVETISQKVDEPSCSEQISEAIVDFKATEDPEPQKECTRKMAINHKVSLAVAEVGTGRVEDPVSNSQVPIATSTSVQIPETVSYAKKAAPKPQDLPNTNEKMIREPNYLRREEQPSKTSASWTSKKKWDVGGRDNHSYNKKNDSSYQTQKQYQNRNYKNYKKSCPGPIEQEQKTSDVKLKITYSDDIFATESSYPLVALAPVASRPVKENKIVDVPSSSADDKVDHFKFAAPEVIPSCAKDDVDTSELEDEPIDLRKSETVTSPSRNSCHSPVEPQSEPKPQPSRTKGKKKKSKTPQPKSKEELKAEDDFLDELIAQNEKMKEEQGTLEDIKDQGIVRKKLTEEVKEERARERKLKEEQEEEQRKQKQKFRNAKKILQNQMQAKEDDDPTRPHHMFTFMFKGDVNCKNMCMRVLNGMVKYAAQLLEENGKEFTKEELKTLPKFRRQVIQADMFATGTPIEEGILREFIHVRDGELKNSDLEGDNLRHMLYVGLVHNFIPVLYPTILYLLSLHDGTKVLDSVETDFARMLLEMCPGPGNQNFEFVNRQIYHTFPLF